MNSRLLRLKTIQENFRWWLKYLMGHSDILVTLNVYIRICFDDVVSWKSSEGHRQK